MDDKTITTGQNEESNMVDPVRGPASNGASEAKDLGDISNKRNPSAPQVPQPQAVEEPEVHILEEHVSRAAKKRVVPTPPSTPPSTPPPVSQAVPVPQAPVPVPAKPAPIPATPTPVAPRAVPASQTPAVSIQNQGRPVLGNDIEKILADVKLPERKETNVSGEKRPVNEQKKFDTSIVGSALNEGADVASAAQSATPAGGTDQVPSTVTPKDTPKNLSNVVAVHTLKDDLQGVVRDTKMSVVKAVSLEEDRRAHKTLNPLETPAEKQRSKRTFGIIFATCILLGLGAGALFGVSYIMNQQQGPPQASSESSILFAEQSVLLSLDGQSPSDLKRILETTRTGGSGTLGSITRIVPVIAATSSDGSMQNRPATLGEFLRALGAHPPEALVRALGSDFFLGLHTVDKNAPIIVVPTTSHDHAFAAMLAWEDTLNTDLAPLFSAVPILTTDKNGLPIKRLYEDLVMRNYDVRALKDDSGTIQLYYSFPTQNILIIAESPYSFPEILSRLQAGRQL